MMVEEGVGTVVMSRAIVTSWIKPARESHAERAVGGIPALYQTTVHELRRRLTLIPWPASAPNAKPKAASLKANHHQLEATLAQLALVYPDRINPHL
jgi:hypothetical protein